MVVGGTFRGVLGARKGEGRGKAWKEGEIRELGRRRKVENGHQRREEETWAGMGRWVEGIRGGKRLNTG